MIGTAVEVAVRFAAGNARGARDVDQLTRTLRAVERKNVIRFGSRWEADDSRPRRIGWDLPDVPTAAALVVRIGEHLQRQGVNFSFTAPRANDLRAHDRQRSTVSGARAIVWTHV
jgi:hypothetical protein